VPGRNFSAVVFGDSTLALRCRSCQRGSAGGGRRL